MRRVANLETIKKARYEVKMLQESPFREIKAKANMALMSLDELLREVEKRVG